MSWCSASSGVPLTSVQGRSVQILLDTIVLLTHPIGIEDIDRRLHAMFGDRNVTEICDELRQWHVMTCFRRFFFP